MTKINAALLALAVVVTAGAWGLPPALTVPGESVIRVPVSPPTIEGRACASAAGR